MSNDKKKKTIILVIIVLALVILTVGIILAFSEEKTSKGKNPLDDDEYKNNYTLVNGEKYADATVITSDALKKDHCLDDICIRDLTIYESDDYNNVEMTIANNGSDTATGSLALVFEERVLMVSYDSLKGGSTVSHRIQLDKKRISNVEDFVVRNLSKEEMSKMK